MMQSIRSWRAFARFISISVAFLAIVIRPSRCNSCAPKSRSEPPANLSFILILADDLGYGDLGTYGQRLIKTPNLDRMAAEGMRFTQFYAGSSLCAPSRCALLTGLHTGHCYIRKNGDYNLRPEDVTVGEVLKQADYVTGMIGKWGVATEGSEGMPTRQGFDYFLGYPDNQHAQNYYPEYLIENEERLSLGNVVPDAGPFGEGVATERVEYSQELLTNRALEFISGHRDTSFFLYIAYSIPHMNNAAFYRGLPAWEAPGQGIYADEDWPENHRGFAAQVTLMDAYVGRLLGLVDSLGIGRSTVIMFSSDNGPTTPRHLDPGLFRSGGPLRGSKETLYEGGLRVPLIVRWPGTVAAGSVSDHLGYAPDILPTLAELAGLDPPAGTDGISLVPTLVGAAGRQRSHRYLYWELPISKGWMALRQGDWKVIMTAVTEPPELVPAELYNLCDDIGESANLADTHGDLTRQMLDTMYEAHAPPAEADFELVTRKRGKRASDNDE